MANKEKKRKDKKRRQRRERKSKLPSSVEALLGYLGKTETTISSQGGGRTERAGVDAYDTLHQIIKSQQMMSANYMQNLQNVAFAEQLQKQKEESQKQLRETKDEVEKLARGYNKKSPEDKIAEKRAQIEWHMKRGEKGNSDTIAAAQKAIQKYQGILEFRESQSTMAPAVGMSPSLQSPSVKVGGAAGGAKFSVSPAQNSSQSLPAIDPLRGMALGGGAAPQALTPSQEVQAGLALMTNPADITSTSLTPVGGGAAAAKGSPAKTARRRTGNGK
jgi:hypothetical protein